MAQSDILITRPEPDASRLATFIKQKGYNPLIMPVMTVSFEGLKPVFPEEKPVQAILFTSANGVRGFHHHFEPQKIPPQVKIFTVGDYSAEISAEIATCYGFSTIESAKGDIDSLISLVMAQCTPQAGVLFHPKGGVTAGNPGHILKKKGFLYLADQVYKANPVDKLSDDCKKRIQSGKLYATVLYSPRTARIFVNLCREHQIVVKQSNRTEKNAKPIMQKMKFLCLSQAVAEIVEKSKDIFPNMDINIAAHPNQASLLRLLDENKPADKD